MAVPMDGMSAFSLRREDIRVAAPEPNPRAALPPETPLLMRRQDISETPRKRTQRPDTAPLDLARRRAILFLATIVLAGMASYVPYKMYEENGLTLIEMAGMGLFGVLVGAISCWFCSAVAGFVILLRGGKGDPLEFRDAPPAPHVRSALLMPLYNEDPSAALARLAAIEASLDRLGASHAFDLFVLSDTTDEAIAADEWTTFEALQARASCNVFYRRRRKNTERKAGNVADWVRRFGGAYAHMIILDADSVMTGETIIKMVDAMERHPGVGLIQTTPVIVNAETLLARSAQFGVRMYGRVAATGLAWWSASEGSYWGHNAIVRVRAFAESCHLPVLPGPQPWGGHIMSHDVVEAALLRRRGWAVHVTAQLTGSYEETPPSLVAFASRDRRWCQGNLQHIGLLGMKGVERTSVTHILVGLMAYLSSPIWLAFLMVTLCIQFLGGGKRETIWVVGAEDFIPYFVVALLPAILLMGPKLLGTLLVLMRKHERKAFGGGFAVLKSVALETFLTALMAPILMIRHTRMIIEIILGQDSGWARQQRTADALSHRDAIRHHKWETVAGLLLMAPLLMQIDTAPWFAPIVLPLIFAGAFSVYTSRPSVGAAARRAGLLVTPEETQADGIWNAAALASIKPERIPGPRLPVLTAVESRRLEQPTAA
jgi:membrane glycosyltransferase